MIQPKNDMKLGSWDVQEAQWKAALIIQMLEYNRLIPRTFCEVDCHSGELLRYMQEKMDPDCDFWGYVSSPGVLEQVQHLCNSHLHFALENTGRSYEDTFHDLSLVLNVIERKENYYYFLRSIRLKAKYTLFLISLNASVQSLLRRNGLHNQRLFQGHLHHFSKETALQSLINTGYEIIDYHYVSSSLELPAPFLSTRLMRVPRRLFYALNKDLAVNILGGYRLLVLTR